MNFTQHWWAFHELMSCFENVAFEWCKETDVKSWLSELDTWENSTSTV
jgi:hypothetical protein